MQTVREMSGFTDQERIAICQLPEVVAARESVLKNIGKQSFTIPASPAIQRVLQDHFGLYADIGAPIPCRWIRGNTEVHADTAPNNASFGFTHIIYLETSTDNDNDNPVLVIDDVEHPIRPNVAFRFREGTLHGTRGAENSVRLLMGPMNEQLEGVGVGSANIYYYSTLSDASLGTGSIGSTGSTILDTVNSISNWIVYSIDSNLTNVSTIYYDGDNIQSIFNGGSTFVVYAATTPCFLTGSKILCLVDGAETQVPIENLTPGTLVKTLRNGFKPVAIVASGIINDVEDGDTTSRLYKCPMTAFPELTDDLYITGWHAILVDTLTNAQISRLDKTMGRVFVTDGKYRLIAAIDDRTELVPVSPTPYTIWHFALENENEGMNYGVFANNLIVESCSLQTLRANSVLRANLT